MGDKPKVRDLSIGENTYRLIMKEQSFECIEGTTIAVYLRPNADPLTKHVQLYGESEEDMWKRAEEFARVDAKKRLGQNKQDEGKLPLT